MFSYVHTVVSLCSTKNLYNSLCKPCYINEIKLLPKSTVFKANLLLVYCVSVLSLFWLNLCFLVYWGNVQFKIRKHIYTILLKQTLNWQTIQSYLKSYCRHNIVHNFWWNVQKHPSLLHTCGKIQVISNVSR